MPGWIGAPEGSVALHPNISTGLTVGGGVARLSPPPQGGGDEPRLSDGRVPVAGTSRRRGRGRRWWRAPTASACRSRPWRAPWTIAPRWSRPATSSSPAAPSRMCARWPMSPTAKGALLLVDGYHAAGQLPVDVRALDVDFYCSGGLKWLLGGTGVAFMYARPELWPTLAPARDRLVRAPGPVSVRPALARAARRRPPARGRNAGTHAGLRAARRPRRARGAGRRGDPPAHDGADRGPDRRGPRRGTSTQGGAPARGPRPASSCCRAPIPPADVRRLAEAGIVADSRPGHVRVSPYFYNVPDDHRAAIERLTRD